MEVIGKLEERISKSGKPYKVLVIELVSGYEKLVFLNSAEIALLESQTKK